MRGWPGDPGALVSHQKYTVWRYKVPEDGSWTKVLQKHPDMYPRSVKAWYMGCKICLSLASPSIKLSDKHAGNQNFPLQRLLSGGVFSLGEWEERYIVTKERNPRGTHFYSPTVRRWIDQMRKYTNVCVRCDLQRSVQLCLLPRYCSLTSKHRSRSHTKINTKTETLKCSETKVCFRNVTWM